MQLVKYEVFKLHQEQHEGRTVTSRNQGGDSASVPTRRVNISAPGKRSSVGSENEPSTGSKLSL